MLKALEKGYVVGDYSTALVKTVRLQGGSVESLAADLGVTVTELCSPSCNLSVERYLKLLEMGQARVSDPYFGLHVGQNMDLESFSVLGLALIKSKTIGEALQQVLALEGFVQSLGYTDVVREQGCVRLIWRCYYQQHSLASVLVESVLAGIIEYSQQLAGRSMPILETTFKHADSHLASPRANLEYGRVYGSRCSFSHSVNSILVADDVLAWPNKLLGSQALPNEQPGSHFIRSVEAYIRDALAFGNPIMAEVAAHHHLTVRTFQRRLAKEGTSFNQLLTQIRLILAQDYLKYSNLTALEVSQILGFKEQSSFNHFFMGQVSMPPSQYRKQYKSEY
jgi:AraC-like DNA-binding protein